MDFSSSAHCVFNLKIHLVFVVAYRRKAISESILTRMSEIFKEVCQDYNAELREFSGESDHVHLLVEISPTVRISDLVRTLKSVSSRKNPTRVQSTNSSIPMGKEVLDEKLLCDFCWRWSLDTSH